MQSPEEFLRDYFRARTEMQRDIGKLHKPIASRFLAPTYVALDCERAVAGSESERILSINGSEGAVDAITTGWVGGDRRMRYRLKCISGEWRITASEFECTLCQGSGKKKDRQTECRLCKGKGWHLLGEIRNA
jgi:hypothetical protein